LEDEIIGPLGDDDTTYEKMTEAAQRRRGGYCRCIMVNPLHPHLPKMVLVLQVT
jgi:hypothetical protein